MNAPQIIWIILTACGVGVAAAKNGQSHKYNGAATFVGSILGAALLWWGGFFG